MADSSEPAFLFLYRKGAVAPVDYLSTFATAPFCVALPLENLLFFMTVAILAAGYGIRLRGFQSKSDGFARF